MKSKRSLAKTIVLGILAVIFVLSIVISPPVKVIYASHTGELIGTALVAGAIGACAGAQMQQDRQPAVIVVEHQHGQGCGHTFYNGAWYSNEQCYQVKNPLYDQDGNFIKYELALECQ
ncbi:MAG: hypothetical protein NTZ97_03015 [Candidatus Moranbacteria bacterium]|nr:hypothetical protein [Candidatus Moranbacteria bacterium]